MLRPTQPTHTHQLTNTCIYLSNQANVDRPPILLCFSDIGCFNAMEEPVEEALLLPEVLEGEGLDVLDLAGSKRRKTKASRPNNIKL